MIDFKRTFQVFKYGWLHSGIISTKQNKTIVYRLKIFLDILHCFKKYKMWSNQYLKEEFYLLNKSERKLIGKQYLEKGIVRDNWWKDFCKNKKFLVKYSQKKYELPHLREKRNKVYAKRYNAGKNLVVEYDVELSRQHYLNGEINIGNNVLLAKHVFIDYSGYVQIGNDVRITDGVHILSHSHKHHSSIGTNNDFKNNNIQNHLKIGDGAIIGTRAIIMPSCNYIGKQSRIGAGAVITKDVPDYAVVVGVPGKIIKYLN